MQSASTTIGTCLKMQWMGKAAVSGADASVHIIPLLLLPRLVSSRSSSTLLLH